VGPGDGWNEDFGALAAETTTSVRVTVRTDFTVRGSTGVTFGWSPGEAVSRANVEIVGTAVRGMTNAAGAVTLDTTGLADGVHTVRVMHADPDRRSNDPVGPAIADPLVTPPSRIYRPLDVQITTAGGLLTNATVAAPHGGIGNRTHLDRTGDRLPIDWKPVWMRSPLKAGESTRTTADITLIVVHQPGGPQIGPVINTFLNATEAQNANYVIDANGHIIKLAEDRRAANQAGASRWGGTTWVNPFSLGIEVVHPAGGFQGVQYDALIGLLRRLQAAYPTIATHRIVGHSDIATSRTDLFTLDDRRAGDPGLDFDWPRLEAAGLGMRASLAEWTRVAANLLFRGHPYFPLREGDRDRTPGSDPRYGGVARPAVPAGVDLVRELQEDLEHIGYTIRQAGGALGRYTLATRKAVDRFQRHFFSGSRSSTRSGITLGVADANTRAWIRAVRVNIP
jgi:N-acetyl-anhydromuramyl-L-alanine amidase AmpD